jgi:hypothetical protein
MTRITFLSALLFFFICSCKVTEKNIIGFYKLDKFPKTTLKINSDKTFDFSKNNRNPYLHPFDHPNEYYLQTRGIWTAIDKKTISLTSQSDTITYPLVNVQSFPPRDNELSYFTFYDTYGDTVRLLYTQLSDGMWVGRLHGTASYFSMDLNKRDTFEFHFYGYQPYKFISGQKINQDYKITLKPFFQPNFFVKTEFRIKRKQLIDKKRKGKYRLTKSGI